MAADIIFLDSFDHYTIGVIDDKWTGGTPTVFASIVAGRTISANQNLFGSLYTLSSPVTNLTIGAFRRSSVTGSNNFQLAIGPTSAICAHIAINGDGTVSAFDATYTRVGTSTKALVPGSTGHYIELGVLASSTAGVIIVRVNGEEVLNLTGQNTRTTITQFSIAGSGGGTATWYDDFYASTDSGGGVSFASDLRVYTLYPNGVGNYSQWTSSTGGANYTCVDETLANVTDWNTGSVANDIDTFTFTNTAFTGPVRAVQLVMYADQPGAGVNSFRGVCRIGGVDYFSSNTESTSTTTLFHRFVWTINPATGVAWTTADIDAAEFGYQIVAAGTSINVYQCVLEVAGAPLSEARVYQVVLEAIGIDLSEARIHQALVELMLESETCDCPGENVMY